MLYAQSERYRQLSYVLAREDRDVDGEHKGIVDACLARNADLACRLIDEHLTRTSDILVTSPALRDTQRQAAAQ
jgi:DNA-binding GntR family transcriptional regulator